MLPKMARGHHTCNSVLLARKYPHIFHYVRGAPTSSIYTSSSKLISTMFGSTKGILFLRLELNSYIGCISSYLSLLLSYVIFSLPLFFGGPSTCIHKLPTKIKFRTNMLNMNSLLGIN